MRRELSSLARRTARARATCWTACAVAGTLLVGCAAALPGPAKRLQPADLDRLAGSWEWSSWLETPARLGSGPLRVRLVDGQLAFETTRVAGTFTLHEGASRRLLRAAAADKQGGGTFSFALTQQVRAGAAVATPAGPRGSAPRVLVLVVQ